MQFFNQTDKIFKVYQKVEAWSNHQWKIRGQPKSRKVFLKKQWSPIRAINRKYSIYKKFHAIWKSFPYPKI